MNIDTSIVKSYLQGNDDFAGHWLFYHILDNGEYVFDKPDLEHREAAGRMLKKLQNSLDNFKPYNIELFSGLFPEWRELAHDTNVVLAVGCPAPYDAMVREYGGREFIIFDLIRLLEYQKNGSNILSLMRQLITHEVSHICIHADYPIQPTTYQEKLSYIVFNEGFAHALAFSDEIGAYDFNPMIQTHYENSLSKLKAALSETDAQKQEEYLEIANCGPYWDKFAAISGKLYIVSHLKHIYEIYQGGPSKLLSDILK